MAQINVSNLTFCYEGSFDNIFEEVSFSIDTNWRLGFVGRNGKGKTTFLNILLGKYEYQGTITTSTKFDYFPYEITNAQMNGCVADFMEEMKFGCEQWRVMCELEKLKTSGEVLYRPFYTLSHGERTKVMLGILFSGEHDFLLIDEPTNHLDQEARQVVKEYLAQKKGFILVSHDRDLLDECVDHVLVLNRRSIEIQSGNFSSWWENKTNKDHYSRMENEKHIREISSLKKAVDRSSRWAQKNEDTKIGFNPKQEHDRFIGTRAYIGAKTKKMQSRVQQYKRRIVGEIEEKEGLLQDIENTVDLKITPLTYHKDILIWAKNYSLSYKDASKEVLTNFDFQLHQGERLFLQGKNGCGKTSLIKAIRASSRNEEIDNVINQGILRVGTGVIISYINQDTSFLKGSIKEYCKKRDLEESIFLAILRQLDLDRVQFVKPMEEYSEGQKKKVLIASSLLSPAHIYIWDEPLNYVDVFSKMQIEKLLLSYQPTMIVVDHDVRFQEKIATKVVEMTSSKE